MNEFDYELTTSVTIVQGCLIVSLPKEMTDEEIEISTNKMIVRANHSSIIGTIFDLSRVTALDSYTFNCLETVARTVALMGVMVVWIGMRPSMISALLDLDVNVSKINTALNLERALEMVLKNKSNQSRGV